MYKGPDGKETVCWVQGWLRAGKENSEMFPV